MTESVKCEKYEVIKATSKAGKEYTRIDFYFTGVDGKPVRISVFPSYQEKRLIGIE